MFRPFALIVEDDAQLSQIYAKTLQPHFDTEIASHGDTALARLKEIVPTLVILDLNLPGAGGKDILNSIREDGRLAQTRVILCTADERQADAIQDKADIVMLKPVSPTQLRELAARFIPR